MLIAHDADEDDCYKGENNPSDCNDGMHKMSCVFLPQSYPRRKHRRAVSSGTEGTCRLELTVLVARSSIWAQKLNLLCQSRCASLQGSGGYSTNPDTL